MHAAQRTLRNRIGPVMMSPIKPFYSLSKSCVPLQFRVSWVHGVCRFYRIYTVHRACRVYWVRGIIGSVS